MGRPQAVAVDLIAVTQARLQHAIACLDLVDESVDVDDQIFVDIVHMSGNHCAKEQPAEPRAGIHWQQQVAEGKPSRWSDRAGVPNFEFR